MRTTRLLLLMQLFGVIAAGVCRGQQPDMAVPAAPGAATVAPSEVDGSEIVIKTRSGDYVPLLLGDDIVREILQRAQEQRSIPRYSILHMEIDGSVDRDKVQLTIELKIRVEPESEWVAVPLSFGDVYLDDFDSSSDAPGSQALLTTREQNSRVWHLRGKGLHTVRMTLVGKTRAVSPGTFQLNLNLPMSTASHSVLRFASPVELQKLPQGAADQISRDDKGVRSVEFWGVPTTFSLVWSDVVARIAQKPVIQVQNRMKLDLTTIPVTLTGTQVLQISGSPVSEVQVTFPEGFQLVEADARNVGGVSILNNFETPPGNAPGPSIIRLTSAIEGTVTLTYDLELMNRQFPQDIKVSIPAILDVNQQPGDLEILFPTGLLVQQKELKGAQRIRVSAESDISVAATAFRMRSPDSQIVLHVEETEAQFAVSPEITLEPDPQNVLATVRYPVSVLTGSLLDVSILWPGYSTGEWQIIPGTMRLVSGKANLPLSMQVSETEVDVLKFTFPERQSGEFTVEFRAFAALDEVRSGSVQLRCPEVSSRLGQSFVLTTLESDAYSIRPISMGTGELLQTVPVPTQKGSGQTDPGLKSESWLHDDPSIPLRLELPPQAPSVRAKLTLGLEPRENGIEVRETIEFEIEHRELQGFSLQVPDGVRPTVRVVGKSEFLRPTIESSNWSFRLAEAKRGSLAIEVIYLWPLAMLTSESAESTYQLPVILPQASDVKSIQAGTSSLSGIRVADEKQWTPVYSEKFDSAVETSSPVTTIPVRWTNRTAEPSGSSPDLILANSSVVGNQVITSTLIVYEKLPEFVSIETPDDLIVESIAFGERSLTSGSGNSGLIQSQRISERKVIRWTVSARKVTGIQVEPVFLNVRVREKLPSRARLWIASSVRRVKVVGENRAVPVIWFLGSHDEYHAISATDKFSCLTQRLLNPFSQAKVMRTQADQQLQSVLAPYPESLQQMAVEKSDRWMSESGRQDLFFGSAESDALQVYLVPNVALLLISAVTCVVFFVVMSVLRQITVILPALIFFSLGLVAWLISPERTLMIAPYAGMGIVFGMVSVTFQRLSSDRRSRLPVSTRSKDLPTVFGFSGVLSPAPETLSDSAAAQARFSSDVSVNSARS